MFSLIITIVSIALVVALVAATMSYGGDTLTEGRNRADAAAFVTAGQQIAGAIQLYSALEGKLPANMEALTTDNKYLTSVPVVKGTDVNFDTDDKTVTATVNTDDVCAAINRQAGLGGETGTGVTALTTSNYGCISGTKLFTFKY